MTEGLTFGYGRHVVGTDVNLSVSPFDVVCLLGPNGCGKTTLFKTMLGLLPVCSGTITLGDRDLGAMSRAEIARSVAYVPQIHDAVFPYTVHDMVLMGRTVHRGLFSGPTSTDHARVERTLDQLEISELSQRDYTKISGGQQQMVMIARALVQEAALVVMDEPTAGLDFGNQLLILQQVKKLAASGLGVLMSTHNPDHAFDCATSVQVLREGRIHIAGAPVDVLTSDVLSDLYGVDISVERVNGGHVVRPRVSLVD